MKWFRDIGPGVLIAAAFIGPGTVTLCTIAGASFGYSLIWAIILSIFSTLVLQEMSLRIGLITKMNLAQVIRINIKQANGIAIFFQISLFSTHLMLPNDTFYNMSKLQDQKRILKYGQLASATSR